MIGILFGSCSAPEFIITSKDVITSDMCIVGLKPINHNAKKLYASGFNGDIIDSGNVNVGDTIVILKNK